MSNEWVRKDRVYIHTTIHTCKSKVSKYALAFLPYEIAEFQNGQIYTHDFDLKGVNNV